MILQILASISATLLVLSGMAKLIGAPYTLFHMWKPPMLSRPLFFVVVVTISLLEMILGALTLSAWALTTWMNISLLMGCFVLFSIYGTMSIRKLGSCGCLGVMRRKDNRTRAICLLWVRNLVLFGSLLANRMGHGALDTLYKDPDGLFPLVISASPLLGFLALVCCRILQDAFTSPLARATHMSRFKSGIVVL